MSGAQPFRVLRHLGEGGYGIVQLVDHKRFGIVAYKTCPRASTEKQAELKVEAERHQTLHHPNVVVLYETVFNSTCCGLFIEYMKYGSVDEFIKRFEVPLTWRIQIIYETACGMFYLHSNHPIIIHGDLSSQNILIGEGFHAKIADFGLSRTLKEDYESSKTVTPLKGKPVYIAPEYFKNSSKRKSQKFDVYGFAVLAWEILSQKQAYHACNDMRLIPVFVERGGRPDMEELDTSIPSTIKQLIMECWHEQDINRPDFEIIKDRLFDHISQIQRELRFSYISLTEQEKENLSNENTSEEWMEWEAKSKANIIRTDSGKRRHLSSGAKRSDISKTWTFQLESPVREGAPTPLEQRRSTVAVVLRENERQNVRIVLYRRSLVYQRTQQYKTRVLQYYRSGEYATTSYLQETRCSTFNDLGHAGHVTGMKIYFRRYDGYRVIGGIEPSYSSGATVLHGSNNYGYETCQFKLDQPERILSAEVRSGFLMNSLTFKTNYGRTLGPFGGDGGDLSVVNPPKGAFLAYLEGTVEMAKGFSAVRHLTLVWGYY